MPVCDELSLVLIMMMTRVVLVEVTAVLPTVCGSASWQTGQLCGRLGKLRRVLRKTKRKLLTLAQAATIRQTGMCYIVTFSITMHVVAASSHTCLMKGYLQPQSQR